MMKIIITIILRIIIIITMIILRLSQGQFVTADEVHYCLKRILLPPDQVLARR